LVPDLSGFIDQVMRQQLLCFLFLFLFISVRLYPQVLLNEFSSSNISRLTDEDGEYNDWIELFNNSSSEINLEGYHISDDAAFLKKWTLPAVLLRPYSYLLIFASDKNRTAFPTTYKTIISRNAAWQYIVPGSEIGDSWKNRGFDASSWNTGSAGFGYGDNDDSTVLNNIISVFARKEFIITNLQEIEEIVLSIDYDDGFVAYINGHEIARNNLGTINPVPYNKLTGSLQREATMYQGGFPENFIIYDPLTFLVEGVNVIAVQGHNCDASSSDLSLIPMLTIGRLSTGSADSVPDYIQLKGRKLHTNFKINEDGETIILSRTDSSVVDSVSPVRMPADLSYGRKPDGENTWGYFSVSTPGSANITKVYPSLNVDTVIFSSLGGYYPGGVNLQLSSANLSDSIFYTIDGSEPTVSSLRYLGTIEFSGNTTVRARSIKSDWLPGPTSTNTYITKKHTLPVVCLSTNPENLWDYNNGIYVLGPHASPDLPNFGANFWQDWERKAHMELYDVDGIRQIDQDIGIKIFGAYSRSLPDKSMALFARKEYGKGSFDYKVFKDKLLDKFEALVLRNAGNDWDQAMMRDGLTSTLIRDMDMDRLAFQPSVVYINGEYWGILNIREKVNSNYLAENHFVDPDNVNLLEFNGSILEGTNSGYMDLINYLNNNTLENDQKYRQVSSKIDLNNYIQYQLTQIYINNKDWPGNNVKYWNTNDAGSLWRWIIYDTDFGFSIWENAAYSFNTLAFALEPNGADWPNPSWSTLFFRRMISNQGFRNQFINQYADRLNTNFTSERVNTVIDSIKQVFLPEIGDHQTRWDLSKDNWQYNYNIIKNYASSRPDYARLHLRSQFNLGQTLEIKVEIDDPGTGGVRVNSVIPQKYPFKGIYFKDLPIRLTALPAAGYKFVKWQMGSLISNSVSLDYNMTDARSFRAFFEPAGSTDTRIVINEINYNSSPAKDTKDWVELFNAGNSTVNLKNWRISDGGPETGYVFPADLIFYPGMYVVVCRDAGAFRKFWPGIPYTAGDMDFGLSSSGDDINLYDAGGNLADIVTYAVTAPWPTDANIKGTSIELIDPLSDNNAGQNWKSGLVGGTPGTLNFQTSASDTTGGLHESSCSLTCYPNPFTDYTTLKVKVSLSGRYRIEIYNIQGKLMNILSDQNIEAGDYYLDWHGKAFNNALLPGGVYIVKLSGEKQHYNSKVIIFR
jgi:hypothetical protein